MTYFPDQIVTINNSQLHVSTNGGSPGSPKSKGINNLTFSQCRKKRDPRSATFIGKFSFTAKHTAYLEICIPKDDLSIIPVFNHVIGTVTGWCENRNCAESGYVTKEKDWLIFKVVVKKKRDYIYNFNVVFYN